MGPCADCGIVEMIAAVGVGLGAGDDRHAALQLDQQDVHARRDLVVVRAVVDDAGNGSSLGRGRRRATAGRAREPAAIARSVLDIFIRKMNPRIRRAAQSTRQL